MSAMLGNPVRRRQIKVSVHKSLLRLLKFSSDQGVSQAPAKPPQALVLWFSADSAC